MKTWIALALFVPAFACAQTARPKRPTTIRPAVQARPSVRFAAQTGSSVSVTPVFTVTSICPRSDGTTDVIVAVQFNGALRSRRFNISADGTSFQFDGVSIASPPAQLVTIGGDIVTILSHINTLLATTAAQSLMAAP